MDDDKKETDEQREDAAKKNAPGGGGGAPADDKARITELEDENKLLKQQVSDLQKQVQDLEAQSKAAANKTRAQKLLRKVEKAGLSFASDEEREQELNRIAGLTDDAFAATEAAYDRAIQPKHALSKDEGGECPNAGRQGDEKGADDKENSAAASSERQLRTDAGVRPLDVDDKKTSLEDKLRDGFMVAYRERVGTGKSN